MATESPIRMTEARGKWTTHKGARAYPLATRMPGDEEAVLVNGHKFRGRRGIVPNRSGSAPPNMEGSLAAIGNLMHNSVLNANMTTLSYDWDCRGHRGQLVSHLSPDMNYSSVIGLIPQFHQSVKPCFDQHLSRGFLPTHKEESEDDRSPQKFSDDVADKNAAVWSGQDSSSSSAKARVALEVSKELPADDTASLSYDSKQGSSLSIQYEDDTFRALENRTPVSGDVNVTSLQSRFQALKVSCPPNLENHEGRGERQQNLQGNLLPHQMFHQSGNFQYQGSVHQVASQGTNNSYVVADQYFHGGQFPSPDVQPVLHSSGFTPQLYATAPATYMQSASPYYFGVQSPGIYPPQYGIGGFPYNANIHPSLMAGYPPHTTIPLGFDGVSTVADVNTQVPGSWEGGTQGFDVQEINRFYGQHGFAPPSLDPRLQLYHTFGDMYTFPGQIDPMALGGGVIGNQVGAFDAQVRPNFTPGATDHRPQRPGVGVQSNARQRRDVDHYGNSVSMGFHMAGPNSASASPAVPRSPMGGHSILGGRSDVSSPNSGIYAGWQGQRGYENSNDQKRYSFLEELKSGKGRRFELSDIAGHVVEFSVDQHGSRFIQQKLENCSVEDKASVFQEVVPHACTLMTDVFGNYVIQKFFEYGTRNQRWDLAKAFTGQILPLSLQMYGCRVIQKALDVIELDQKIDLVRELDGHVMRCVRDQNGNHVVQKCIECVPSGKIGFIIAAFHGQIASLSMHPYGCRVIQRVLEHCTDELQSQFIVDEILESVCSLAQDQYGNYVTQHILERGNNQERSQIIKNLRGQVVKMSQHKFASNVIEKCLEYGDAPSRELIIDEVVGQNEGNDNLLVMMKDQYANYVVQKILEKCAESQRELLLDRVKVHLNALKKYTYGKHIVARFEQLFGEISTPTS